jgi:type I restriction enzyme, S subunit
MNPWPKVRLGEVLSLDLDRVSVDPATSYLMVGVLSFGRGLFDKEPVENGNTSYRYFYRLKADHVVMSQLFGWEGALALSSEKFAGKFVSPQFPTFKCDSDRLNRYFLGWAMRRPAFWDDLGTRASGMGDRRRTLNPEALFACEISLPPLQEQRRIVARIEELSSLIDEARTLRQDATDEAEALVATRMHQVFNFNGARTTVGDFAKVQGGYAFASANYDETGTHQIVRIGNVRDGYLDLSRAPVRWNPANDARVLNYKLKPGDLVISMTGTREKRDYGFIAKVKNSQLLLNQRVGRFVIQQEIDKDYLFHFLRSPYFRDRLFPSATGTANQANIGNRDIERIKFEPPPISDQRRAADELDSIEAEVSRLKSQQVLTTAEADALLPAILDHAFRGKL